MNERNTQILKIFDLALQLRESGKPASCEILGCGIVTVSVWADHDAYRDWLDNDGRHIYQASIFDSDGVEKAVEIAGDIADLLVDYNNHRGDGCGYLAAQAKARMRMHVQPTAEQQEAWDVCNAVNSDLETF